jgi:hypothetical protein
MAEPTLSPSQLQGLQSAKSLADAGVSAATNQIAAVQSSINTQQNVDDAIKTLFDYNNLSVISNYELERRYMDGYVVQNPISESDLLAFVSGSSSRLQPGASLTPTRIAQFDGGPIVYVDAGIDLKTYPIRVLDQNELAQFLVQDYYLNLLQNGFSYTGPTTSVTTATALTPTSTRLTTNLVSTSPGIVSGQWIVASSSSTTAVMQVNSISGGGPGPSAYTITFTYVVPPASNIAVGANIVGSIAAFSNSERSSKITSNPKFQNVMNAWVAGLKSSLNIRLQCLTSGISAFDSNGNDLKSSQARADKVSSQTFIQNYLINTDISNAGISSLKSEESSRKNKITQRVGIDIKKEILNGSKGSFYDRRYALAVARTTLGNGSLYVLNQLQKQLSSVSSAQASAQSLSNRWNSFLS